MKIFPSLWKFPQPDANLSSPKIEILDLSWNSCYAKDTKPQPLLLVVSTTEKSSYGIIR